MDDLRDALTADGFDGMPDEYNKICNTKFMFFYRQFEQNKKYGLPSLWPTSRIIAVRVKTVFKIVDEAKFYDIICNMLKRNFSFGRYILCTLKM